MKKSIYIVLMLLLGFSSYGQLATDILRYGQTSHIGTARSLGVGNSMSALGGDFTAAAQNPAGIAGIRFSEFSFGMGTTATTTRAVLLNTGTDVSYSSSVAPFSINHAHIVVAEHDRNMSGWRGISFGVGFNRLANYNREFYYDGISPGTITERFANQADGLFPDELNGFEDGLAYEVGAIYPSSQDETIYLTDFIEGEPVSKSQLVQSRGSLNELTLNLGMNYEDKLYLGFAGNIVSLDYSEDKVYSETDEVTNSNAIFETLDFEEDLSIDGSGFNAKFGVIYKPNFNIRLGTSIQTPTVIEIDEEYTTALDYAYTLNGYQNFVEYSPEGFFNYKVRTPWRFNAGAAFIAKKIGFISMNAEYIDYKSSRFNFHNTLSEADITYEGELNNTIRRDFSSAWDLSVGSEIRLDKFRLRLGGGYFGSPFGSEAVGINHYNAGIGFHSGRVFLDLGGEYSTFSEGYRPYVVSSNYGQSVDIDGNNLVISATFGVKFD